MKKDFIKLNADDNHLSLGNLFRIIKMLAKNKTAAIQSELFCILFEISDINDTTVNNYCIGARSISDDYKQIFIRKETKYQTEKNVFVDSLGKILNIIDGTIYLNEKYTIDKISQSENALVLAQKLYNLAKNDRQVSETIRDLLKKYLDNGNIYECLVQEILFVVLYKKQPITAKEIKREIIDNILNDTSISAVSLEEYLTLKFQEGINYDYALKNMAERGNAYASYELGCEEFKGHITGKRRFDKAYSYFKSASSQGHSSANYMLGFLYIEGFIGNKSKSELELGAKYINMAAHKDNPAAINYLGNMYYEGIYPYEKDIEMAQKYFLKASTFNHPYAYNNLGKLAENSHKYKEAFTYFLKSADLGESWALNKVGEYYRKGIIYKDMRKAYDYYLKATEMNYLTCCFYSYYNLAHYYYKNGYEDIPKDEKKLCEFLIVASTHNIIEAMIELFFYYVESYMHDKQENIWFKIFELKSLIENHPHYNKVIDAQIEKCLKEIKMKKNIDLSFLESDF